MSKKNRQARDMELEPTAETAVEVEAPKTVAQPRAEAPKVEFDGWWAARASKIPAIHKKEIIKADFLGRKMPMVATMAEFDAALKKYGVQLA